MAVPESGSLEGFGDTRLAGTRICHVCTHECPATGNFCSHCGASLRWVARTMVPLADDPLVARLVRGRAALDQSLKFATVMFVDVADSTRWVTSQDHRRSARALDDLISTMVEAVHSFDGVVAQILGDGIMAMFGAPLAHETHALCAAAAAARIHERLAGMHLSETDWLPRARIGLHSGEVSIRPAENDFSLDIRAVGPTTYVASRMESLAKPGQTCVTDATAALLDGYVVLGERECVIIKGIREPQGVRVLGRLLPGDPFEIRAASGLTPFIGREVELGLLRSIVGQANGASGVAALIQGEAGIGKSRLVLELLTRQRFGSNAVCRVEAGIGRPEPYGLLAACLRRLLRLRDDASAKERGEQLGSAMKAYGLAVYAPTFAQLLDLDVDSRVLETSDPMRFAERSFSALRALLECMAGDSRQILWLEDLHRSDEESIDDFVAPLLRQPVAGLAVIMTTRDRPSLPRTQHVAEIKLEPLGPTECEAMIDSLIGRNPALYSVRDRVLASTTGNALFMEEMLRSWGHRTAAAASPEIRADSSATTAVPPSLEALISARVDRLAPALRRTLGVIAVFNAAVAVADVAAVLDVDEDDVSTWLDILHGQQLVSWTSDGDHIPKARLIHDVVGEVIRKQMAPEHRSSMHGRICTAVVERHGERAAPLVGNLVYHAHEAGRTDLVVRLAPPAVRRALARYANREAVSILEMAIPAVDGLASTQANAETGVAFRLQAMMPLLVLGQVQRMAELLDQAQSRLAEFPNPALLGAVRIHQATIEWMRGQYDRASQAAADALTIAGQQDNVRLELAAKHSLATIEHAYGKYDATCALSEQIVSAFDGELRLKRLGWVGLPSVFARTYLGSALTNLGEFQRAATVLQEGLEIAELSEQPYSQVFVAEELAFMKLWMGESRQAEALLTQALERTERHAIHNMHAPVSGRLAIALAMNGRADAAIDVATKALTQRTYERAARYGHHFLLHGLAFAQASAGRHEDARATAQQLVSALAELGESGHLAWAWLLLSACAETAGDQQAAVDNARNAAKLAAQCGMLPTLGLARVIEQRCSRTGTALSSIATAEGDVCCPEFDREPMMLNPIVPVG